MCDSRTMPSRRCKVRPRYNAAYSVATLLHYGATIGLKTDSFPWRFPPAIQTGGLKPACSGIDWAVWFRWLGTWLAPRLRIGYDFTRQAWSISSASTIGEHGTDTLSVCFRRRVPKDWRRSTHSLAELSRARCSRRRRWRAIPLLRQVP